MTPRWLARARSGDLAAFNALVETHQDCVYGLCLRMLASTQAAEDVTQDAFLAAYRRIDTFRGGVFRAWLLRIAANACTDELRRRGRRPQISLDQATADGFPIDRADESESPEDSVLRGELSRHIQAGLMTLPIDQRTVVVLCDVQGLSLRRDRGGAQRLAGHRKVAPQPRSRPSARNPAATAGTFAPSVSSYSLKPDASRTSEKEEDPVRFLGFRRHPVSEEELSAYIDDRLGARAKERIDEHLHSCADCSRKLEEMRSLVAEMRSLPQATAPRSFAISPELAAATHREAERSRQEKGTTARRVYLGFSGATVAAVVLLVAVAGVDLLASRGAGQTSSTGTFASARQSAATTTDKSIAGAGADSDNLAPQSLTPPAPGFAPENNGTTLEPGAAAAPTPANTLALPSGEGKTTAQQAQPISKESSHLWLWIVEGAAGGLVVGFGASAFWMRRRWVRIRS